MNQLGSNTDCNYIEFTLSQNPQDKQIFLKTPLDLSLRDEQQLVACLQVQRAVGHEELGAALDNHHQGSVGEDDFLERVAIGNHLGGDGEVGEVGIYLVGELHAEVVASLLHRGRETQLAGEEGERGALQDEREQGDEEDDVEDLI